MSNEVAEALKEYDEYREIIALPEALMGGTRAMIAAGKQYLPQDAQEKDKQYVNRLNGSILFNGYKRTINYLAGQVFSKKMVLGEDVPQEIADLSDDIDLLGNNLDVFAKKSFSDGVSYGVTHILVDAPAKKARTVKEQKEDNLRPYLKVVKGKDVIGWRVNNNKLTQVRIKESVTRDVDSYGSEKVDRIRVLSPGYFKVFQKEGKGAREQWSVALDDVGNPIEGSTGLDYIPLATFMPGEQLTHMTATPPLDDLAWLNKGHWQSDSDQRNILHIGRVPLLFGKGLDVDKVVAAMTRMLSSDEEWGDLKYVEHQGHAIKAGWEDIDRLEKRIGLYGLQLLLPKTGSITATEKALDSAESDSTLKSWALMFQDFLNNVLWYMADYLSLPAGGELTVNTDFRMMLNDVEQKILMDAVREKILSRELVFREFQRRGLIGEKEEWEENLALLENESRQSGSFGDLARGILQAGQ